MTEKEYSHQEWLVDLIVKAVADKGSHPDYHDKILAKQRKLHPALWHYLDGLVQYKLAEKGDKIK